MKTLLTLLLLLATPILAEGPYPVDPASRRQPTVPAGKTTSHEFKSTKTYPGATYRYWIHTPANHDPSKTAALMVFLDGGSYVNEGGPSKATIVLDNLIAKGEMPPTIGLFIDPGVVPAANENAQPRFNRSYEYDNMSADYSTFLVDEILPLISKSHNISQNPDHRGICGASSGAIAAFNVAWQRPDAFRRVYSMIGTYVGLRGGDEFATLIRKIEPKPLRIFLQDGNKDLDIYCGDWWVANQGVLSALKFSGYPVEHVWGEGAHSHQHGGAILPQALRWLWKDWRTPLTNPTPDGRNRAKELLIPGEEWQVVSTGHGFTEGPVAAPDGSIFFTDIPNSKIHRIAPDGTVSTFLENSRNTNGLAFGPDGRLYGCRSGSAEIVSWNLSDKSEKIHASNIKANDLVVAHDGTIYTTEPDTRSVWVIPPGAEKQLGTDRCNGVNGITLTPDQTRLDIADPNGRYIWSAFRKSDGLLENVQPYHHLHLPPADPDPRSRADGLKTTRDGWLLVATAMGIQIFDQPGRVNLILPLPHGHRPPSNLCLAGPELDTLYVTAGNSVLKRKTRFKGLHPWQPPVNPPKPGL
jgi:sugar lactone lactonase YvrE/enterochelin esterase-like enzyme